MSKLTIRLFTNLLFLGSLVTIYLPFLSPVMAETKPSQSPEENWTSTNSDPKVWQWMVGSPPPSDRIIRFTDGSYFQFPQMRWSVCNFQQLMPTKNVSRGLSQAMPLVSQELKGIDQITFKPLGKTETMSWQESLNTNFTDGIVVLHQGKIVYQKYFGCLSPTQHHAIMSMTKSFVGLLGEILVAENQLQADRLVKNYIPELANSAFGNATVRQVLDMTTGLDYSEDYANPKAGVWQHAAAGNPLPKPADYSGPQTYFEFLQTVPQAGEHGSKFGYKTVNTDVLGWLISRVTGKPLTEVLSEKIWRKIGADIDAYFTVDSIGTPFAGGGMNATLLDIARFGQMILDNGKVGNQQIIPATVIETIRQGGDKQAFASAGYSLLPGWSYRSMWWITHNKHGAFMARGVHGQSLYIDPQAKMVIVRFGSHPTAGNAANDPTTLPAYEALADYLMANN